MQKLLEDVNRRIEALPPCGWSAYELNMRGRTFMLRPQSRANRQTALDCFERALNCDPGSARARMGIANVLVSNILDGWVHRSKKIQRAPNNCFSKPFKVIPTLPKLTHTWESFAGSRLG